MSAILPHMVCGLSANLRCRSETCCTWFAENTGRKKVAKNRHLGTIPQLCRAISSQLRHVSTMGKNLLSSNMSSTCPHNMVNFGSLAAEIGLPVWGTGTPVNLNGFRVLAALLHGSQVVSVSQTLWRGTRSGITELTRGRQLYWAGRPWCWASAHIIVYYKLTAASDGKPYKNLLLSHYTALPKIIVKCIYMWRRKLTI